MRNLLFVGFVTVLLFFATGRLIQMRSADAAMPASTVDGRNVTVDRLAPGNSVVVNMRGQGTYYPGAIDYSTFVIWEQAITDRDHKTSQLMFDLDRIVRVPDGATVTILSRVGAALHIELPDGRRAYVPPYLLR